MAGVNTNIVCPSFGACQGKESRWRFGWRAGPPGQTPNQMVPHSPNFEIVSRRPK